MAPIGIAELEQRMQKLESELAKANYMDSANFRHEKIANLLIANKLRSNLRFRIEMPRFSPGSP